MKQLEPGTRIDCFEIKECIHSGSMAHIYSVEYAKNEQGSGPCAGATALAEQAGPRVSGFAMVMKIPRMDAAAGAENIVGFEVELQIYPTLTGPHVPRFVAAGDLLHLPYLVMEHVQGATLQHWLDQPEALSPQTIAQLGDAMAIAAHSLHRQNVCHLDLKPANVLIRDDGTAVLLDFGLSCHAHYPDLLAEEMRQAVGSPAWIAPEQVVGVRGDLRSDIFAIGVMLYQLATGEYPFGAPLTQGGLRQRLWMTPIPPRRHRPDLPDWLQEIILRCLEPEAAQRYPSAAHLAFDLANPGQVAITERGRRTRGVGAWTHFKRWIKAAGMCYKPSPLPAQQIDEVPILMVAIPHDDVTDATLYSLKQAVRRSLGIRPGARLACVTVISPADRSTTDADRSATALQRKHLARLKQWAQSLDMTGHSVSCHVIEAGDVAQALVRYAQNNFVSVMILGAATHGIQMQRLVATVPMRVVRDAPCTVILVKQQLPFSALARES
ncbi:MAG: serine/threonine protein kinase [Pollutimonas bauzanensis]|uniref:Serine/threonine protein kinase n=1 Tax=Pollutimonas bauzanensis TaxID=658167 RepID=A0A1M5LZI6_9BURK|nr:bifunctional serine/threonine-protein kinase/universal stress protein [Pollutimonas bauzanensis]SHG70467.1 Serine/threonine protein kinase [Pollutimonas bauzanensis]